MAKTKPPKSPKTNPIPPPTPTDKEEEAGVRAIIALQKLAGIDEPEDRARSNWRGFSASEKQVTLETYAVLREVKENKGNNP